MADNANVIDFIREQFARVHRRFDEFDTWRRETTPRLSTIERQIGHLIAIDQEHYASLSERLDNVTQRLERIERRLDLVEASDG
jgi:tetrahydromethanopterin S-methyltransferase subunit G